MRQDPSHVTPNPGPVWGWICLVAAAACAIVGVAYHRVSSNAAEVQGRRQRTLQTLAFWARIGLVLVLGWLIREEMIAGFGDGIRNPSQARLLEPGNIYYGIVIAYCLASGLRRALRHRARIATGDGACGREEADGTLNLDWLATYCSLSVILIAGVGVNMTTWWMAPIWFGILGVTYGIGYYLLSWRSPSGELIGELEQHAPAAEAKGNTEDPNLERWGVFVGLLYGLGLSLRKTLKGGANIYLGDEMYWDRVCWNWVAFLMLICLLAGIAWLLATRLPRSFQGDAFPRSYGIIWLVLIAENVVAQVVTGPVFGPRASWNDFTFNVIYLILFALTAVIVFHYHFLKNGRTRSELA
jgi:hypothetical protein